MTDEISELKEAERVLGDSKGQESPDGTGTLTTSRRGNLTHEGNNWMVGIVLVVVGAALLVANFGGYRLHNWWAIFIMLPALGIFRDVYRNYRVNGQLSGDNRGKLAWGCVWLTVAIFFLFNMDWTTWWPLLLIVGGGAAVLSGLLR